MAEKRNSNRKHPMEQQNSSKSRNWRQYLNLSSLRHPSRFSKPQMLIFVLAFALIGYLIYRTFAAAPLIATLEAEQMTPSGVSSNSNTSFMTSLTNNATITTPYLWTFDPGVSSTAGYFWANGKLLKKITGPGPYVLRINSGMLKGGTNHLGHAWDTASGQHQTAPSNYSIKVNNVSGGGFITTLTSGMTVKAPYIWAFDAGTGTKAGYFWADGNLLTTENGSGPYAIMMDSSTLTDGSHTLGQAWDTTGGVHQTPPNSYQINYNGGTSNTNYKVIDDASASGGEAAQFGGGVTLTSSVNLSSSVTSLTVMAEGQQCNGVWPQIKVRVDGTSVIDTSVSSTGWAAYTATVSLAAGSHTVTISNSSVSSCASNLAVDVTNFYGPPPPGPTVSLSASPTTVSSGQSATLTWNATNANSCTASGSWSGSKTTSGSASTGALNQTSTYSLTCTGDSGSATASATVTVSAGFTTSLTDGMTITPPYTWTFNPGVTSTKGYFWADGQLLATATPNASGTYTFVLQNDALSSGSHTLGQAWDLPDGTHQVGPANYTVTVSNTGGSSGSCPSGNTAWCSATGYSAPSFTPTRTVDVYSQSAFMTAWNNLQPGDQINVHGVTFTGEVTLANKNLSNWAQVSFDSTTKFVGVSSAQNLPSVWIHDDSHIRFYGGDISAAASGGQAGGGILVYKSSYITWWNFVAHDTGGDGLSLFPATGVIDHADFKGEVYHWGQNLSFDPHTEKGSGLHGANISDSNYALTNSRVALYAHDGAAGAGLEMGSPSAGTSGNTIYMWCKNLTFKSITQTGGNCIQVWGKNTLNNTISYLEAENLQGRPYDTEGLYSGQSLSSDTIIYGRSSNTNLNSQLDQGRLTGVRWDTLGGTVFQNISPTP